MFRRVKSATEDRVQRAPEPSPPPSIISANLRIIGDLNTDGDVQIDGIVDGDVRGRLLTIGTKAVINGSIAADTVKIAGAVNGEVTARVVQLSGTAHVVGNINHQSLLIHAGAYVQGLCRHIEPKSKQAQSGHISQNAEDEDVTGRWRGASCRRGERAQSTAKSG